MPRRLGRILATTGLLLIAAAALTAQSASAGKKLAQPRSSAWKIIAPTGGKVIGKFKVTKGLEVTGFTIRVPEEGPAEPGAEVTCPGATLKIPGGTAYELPITHFGATWIVGVNTGTFGGGEPQAAETVFIRNGARELNSTISMVLATRQGKRSGDLTYAGDECGAEFLVKPG